MKKTIFVLLVLCSSFLLFATDSLVGTWETADGKVKWVLRDDGTGELIRSSTNEVPGIQTMYVKWSMNEATKTFSYQITRCKLDGSGSYDFDKPSTDNKKYEVPYTLLDNKFTVGDLTYKKR